MTTQAKSQCWWDLWCSQLSARLSRVCGYRRDDVTSFDDLGAHTRLDGIHALQSYLATLEGQIPEHTYKIIDPKVQVYGELGILTQRYHPFSLDGEPLTPWKSTTVYRYTNGEWCLVHAHWSMVKEAGD